MDLILSLVLVAIAALAGWLLTFGDPDRVGVAGTLLGGVIGFLAAWLRMDAAITLVRPLVAGAHV